MTDDSCSLRMMVTASSKFHFLD